MLIFQTRHCSVENKYYPFQMQILFLWKIFFQLSYAKGSALTGWVAHQNTWTDINLSYSLWIRNFFLKTKKERMKIFLVFAIRGCSHMTSATKGGRGGMANTDFLWFRGVGGFCNMWLFFIKGGRGVLQYLTFAD